MADLNEVNNIYQSIWSAKFREASQALKNHSGHAVYDLLLCEIATATSLLSEKKQHYAEALKQIDNTIKDCTIVWRNRKPHLKAYLKQYGVVVEKPTEEGAPAKKKDNRKKEEVVSESGINTKFVASALWVRAILAETAFMASAIKFREQKYLKGMLDFKKSWNRYRECDQIFAKLCNSDTARQEIPNLDEIRCIVDFGTGLFHFICSVVPRHFQFIVEGIGFKADRALAMEELTRSMNCKNGFRSHFAAMCIAWIKAFFYEDYEFAYGVLAPEMEQFKDSAILLYTQAYILRKEGKIGESTECLRRAHTSIAEIPEFQTKLEYELGNNHFLLLEWEDALRYLVNFLNNSNSETFRAFCAYQIGFSYFMLGDADKAAAYMKKIQPWVRKNFALDEYAGRQAKKFLNKKGFTEFEVALQQASLNFEAGKFQDVIQRLDAVKDKESSPVDTLRSVQLRGDALTRLRDFESAKAAYNEVISKEKEITKSATASYVVPFSLVGLCEIAIIEKDAANADNLHKKAKTFSNYEFESMLNWRLRKCEEDIRALSQ